MFFLIPFAISAIATAPITLGFASGVMLGPGTITMRECLEITRSTDRLGDLIFSLDRAEPAKDDEQLINRVNAMVRAYVDFRRISEPLHDRTGSLEADWLWKKLSTKGIKLRTIVERHFDSLTDDQRNQVSAKLGAEYGAAMNGG